MARKPECATAYCTASAEYEADGRCLCRDHARTYSIVYGAVIVKMEKPAK